MDLNRQSRYRYFYEFLIIFLSVMLAFIAEDWRENRQDYKDYISIKEEIKANIRLDSIEFSQDIRAIEASISDLQTLLQEGDELSPTEAHRMIFSLTFVRWSDYKSTGYDQLKNSRSFDDDQDLIDEINNYYGWLEYLKGSFESFYSEPTGKFLDFLMMQGITPDSFVLSKRDIESIEDLLSKDEFRIQLKYLLMSRKRQLDFFGRAYYSLNLLLAEMNGRVFVPKVEQISIVGSAVPIDTVLQVSSMQEIFMNPVKDHSWSIDLRLNEGVVQFRADQSWSYHWGANGFPRGKGQLYGGGIPVSAGTYQISFNDLTGEYSFRKLD